ncbi:MAG: LPS-assembly protein LptD [Bacteroidetes bacterium]|nr:LPS-assembly protein LptD [Bacteroidota bacterium]
MIFTAIFFSVTFNSPANYSGPVRFTNSITYTGAADGAAADTVRPDEHARLPSIVKLHGGASSDTARFTLIHDQIGPVTDTLEYKISKDTMEARIDYKATDSIVMVIPSRNITLYSKANAKYKDADLTSDVILYDQNRNVVIASPTRDSAGNVINQPKMVQADNKMQADTIVYNVKSKKAVTRQTYTNSGEMFVHAEKIKKVTDDDYFGYRGIFTTCNLDTPHFAFRTNRMKIINKKMAITGPIHPEFEGVPIPIYIPFGFFPLSTGRHSGLLPPQFTANDQAGLGLEGLGYYKVLNEYFDVTLRTNLYSYGGWNLYVTPTYRVRYKYSGQMSFALQNTRLLSDVGKDAYTNSKTFSLNWSHQVDSKAHPGQSFSANVNVASTKYNRYLLNNPTANYTNQLSSSVTYSKTWDGKYNLTVGANHSQNNQTGIVNVSLPNLAFSAPTLYPFQRQAAVGEPKWYEKFGIGLNSTVAGSASFYDSLFSFKRIIDTFQYGSQHSIPISLTLPLKGPVQVTPGMSLQVRTYSQKLFRRYNYITNKIDTVSLQKGMWAAEDVSFSLSLASAIFGTFQNFGRNSTLMGIRHVIRPTLSISYKPDLSKAYYYSIRNPHDSGADTKTYRLQRVSYFDGTTYGPFGEGTFGGISFGLDNHFEIKTRSKTDTSTAGIKKITIIDGIGFNGSYNYLADSFKLSPIQFYFRSTLFQNINITGGATLNPYQMDTMGFNINKYAWEGKKFSLGKITQGNLAISTSFKSKPKDEKLAQQKAQNQQNQIPLTVEEQQAQLNYIRNNPGQFADFNIPWSLNLAFALNFVSAEKPDYSGFATTITSSVNWSGDFNLTEKWKIGLNGYYDLKTQKIQSLQASISRDLHCWQMSINVTPVGYTHFFNFTISPKSGILQDLRINRTKYFYNQ